MYRDYRRKSKKLNVTLITHFCALSYVIYVRSGHNHLYKTEFHLCVNENTFSNCIKVSSTLKRPPHVDRR